MNIKDWFGSLDLAFRYALVFGCLLGLVLILGVIKLIYDKRRLKKFSKIPVSSATTSEDRENLAPHEKDEGSLFGIRAIEAGFFGGVVQSRPTSLANTPRESLADLSRTGSPKLRALRRQSSEWSLSAPSSILDLERFDRDRDSISVASPTYRSTSRLISMASEPILGQRTSLRNSPSPKALIPLSENRERLRPSTAQRTGRHSHDPSPIVLEFGDHALASPRITDAPPIPSLEHSRLPISPRKQRFRHSETLDFLQMGAVQEHPIIESGASLEMPEFDSAPLDLSLQVDTPPKEKFVRGSVASDTSSRSSRATIRRVHSPPPPVPSLPPPVPTTPPATEYPYPYFTSPRQPPPLPTPPLSEPSPCLPAFPLKAVIDPENAKFTYFRKDRELDEPAPRQYAHNSMPLLVTSEVARNYIANNPAHRSMDVLPDDAHRSSFLYSLPELRPRSPLRLSMAFTQDSVRNSARSLDPKIDSNHTSFSFTPTLPEYMGHSHNSFEPRRHRFGDSPGSSSSSSPARGRPREPHTDGYFAVNPVRVSLKRKSNDLLV